LLIKRSGKRKTKTRKDKGSLIILWLMITFGFACGFFLSGQQNHFLSDIGILFIIGGLIIRWMAILQLGNSFTVDVAITNAAKLKTDGIYTHIRHPSYSGMLLVVVGFSATMNSLYSVIVFVVPVFAALIYRISVEEKVLINEFGDSYLTYKVETKRLIPGIF